MITTYVLTAIAALLAILGNVPYIRSVIRREITPHPYSWFVWSIVSMVTLFGGIARGAGIGAIPTAVSESFTIIIFLLSLRYGFRGAKRSDTVFLIIAMLGLIPWIITRDPTWSVVTVVTIDAIAFIPTIRKTYNDPASENITLFVMNAARHIMTLMVVQEFNVATTLHSIVMIVTNSLMTIIIGYYLYHRYKFNKSHLKESSPVNVQ